MATKKKKQRELTPEEMEFIQRKINKKREEQEYERRKLRYHNWGESGKTTHSHFRAVRKEGDKLFYEVRLHRYFSAKNKAMSLFPDAKSWDMVCGGEGVDEDGNPKCKICAAVDKVRALFKNLEGQGKAKSDEGKMLHRMINSAKGKSFIVWVSVTRNPKKGEDDKIEVFRIPKFFFDTCPEGTSINDLITEKELSLLEWLDENPEYQEADDSEKEIEFLLQAAPKRTLPDDKKNGWSILVKKSGAGLETKYAAEYGKKSPLVKGSTDFKILKEAIESNTYPDMVALLKVPTMEDQHTLIGDANPRFVKAVTPTDEGPEDDIGSTEDVDVDAIGETEPPIDGGNTEEVTGNTDGPGHDDITGEDDIPF